MSLVLPREEEVEIQPVSLPDQYWGQHFTVEPFGKVCFQFLQKRTPADL